MPSSFVIFPTPANARVTLTPDGQPAAQGVAYTDPQGRQGQVCYVADGVVSGHGAALRVEGNEYVPFDVRGLLVLDGGMARLQVDDVHLTETPEPPPPDPPPDGDQSPEEIIEEVYENTRPNLATVEGCGRFTEDCCTALHTKHSRAWGHVDKDPGQNQYNGHAVDAVMLLNNTADTSAGVYDIIFSSASPEAKPAFNYQHPPNPEDWVYPAESQVRGTPIAVSYRPRRIPR